MQRNKSASIDLYANRRKETGHEGYSFFNNIKVMKTEGWIVSMICFALWICFTQLQTKIDVIMMAATYSFIEWSWYTFTVETTDRIVYIAPLHVKGRPGFTTVEQFIGNVLYLPISINGYIVFFAIIGIIFPHLKPLLIPLRIFCFPLNIWLLEIVQDDIFKFLFGFNPAWDYTGAPGSLFDGAINLAHAKLWIVLGILAAFFSPIHGIYVIVTILSIFHLAKFIARRK